MYNNDIIENEELYDKQHLSNIEMEKLRKVSGELMISEDYFIVCTRSGSELYSLSLDIQEPRIFLSFLITTEW